MIDDLIKRLKGAEEGSKALDIAIARHLGFRIAATTDGPHIMRPGNDEGSWNLPHYTRSLNIALKLIKDVNWDIAYARNHYMQYIASVDGQYAKSHTPALALCLAWAYALKARKAVG